MSIAENYRKVREEIAGTCLEAGRKEDEVTLVAVTKYVEPGRILEAYEAGARAFGENHAQEVREKLTFYKEHQAELHFIGQLQTNKIKYILGNTACIESADRASLVEALETAAAKKGLAENVLLQVNIGREPQKGGVLPEELPELAGKTLACPHLSLRGLMCVPPADEPGNARKYFAELYALREKLRSEYPAAPLTELSMGMSRDYREAVLEGATLVRVGSAIFGMRNKL